MNHKFKLSLIFIFIAINAIAQNPVKYQGLLWEIKGNGLKKPSYLYGTMHVSQRLAFRLCDSFFIALNQAQVVGLENDPSHWMEEMTKARDFEDMSSDYSYSYEDDDYSGFYLNLFKLDIPNKDYFRALLSSENYLANGMLYRNEDRGEDYEEDTYLDMFIFQTAKRKGKQLVGVEHYSESEKLTREASIPVEYKKKESDKIYKDINYEMRYSIQSKIEDAYRLGNLDLIDSLQKVATNSKKYLEYMLYLRNKNMAKSMDTLMKKNQVFVGVGAAHLAGEKGVIELLRSMGYTVRAVGSKSTSFATKQKEQIEKLQVKLEPKVFHSTDDDFSVALPEKLYSIGENENIKAFFYPDMINGAYYMVYRLNTYSAYNQHTPQYVLSRIDSLLFEYIPGKIISKKELVINGFPAFDIINKTKKGDYQRRVIIATHLHLYYFSLCANGQYAKGKIADDFAKSIQIKNDLHVNSTYTPKEGGFKITMPGNIYAIPNYQTDGFSAVESYDKETGNYYFVKKMKHVDYQYIENDSFEAIHAGLPFHKDLAGKNIQSNVIFKNYPIGNIKSGKWTSENEYLYHLNTQSFSQSENYFILGVISKDSLANHETFFNSFEYKAFINLDTFKTLIDTNLNYKVRTFVDKKLLEKKDYRTRYSWSYNDKYNDRENQYDIFKNNKTNEHVNLKINEYLSEIDSAFFDSILYLKYLKTNEKLIIDGDEYDFKYNKKDRFSKINLKSIKFLNHNSNANLWIREIYICDPNSTKIIRKKCIIQDNKQYILTTQYDSKIIASAFKDTIFNSFMPLPNKANITGNLNNPDTFLVKIWDKDSMTHEQIIEKINSIQFTEKHIPEIFKTINSYYGKKSYTIKYNLIEKLSNFKSSQVLEFLKNKYYNFKDTTYLQSKILETLTAMKSNESTKLFLELIKSDPPLIGFYNDFDINRNLSDSLMLTKTLFPDLVDLYQYDEYKSLILSLLVELIDSNLVDFTQYQKLKEMVLLNSKIELKKFKRELIDLEIQKEFHLFYSNSFDNNYRINFLERNCQFLIKFFNEPNIKNHIEQIMAIKDNDLKLRILKLAFESKINNFDTVLQSLLKDEISRYDAFKILKDSKRLSELPKEYATRNCINQAKIISKIYNYDKNDSIVYLKHFTINEDSNVTQLYYYKIYIDLEYISNGYENRKWYLIQSEIVAKDSNLLDAKYGANIIDLSNYSILKFEIKDNSKIDEMIDDNVLLYKMKKYKRWAPDKKKSEIELIEETVEAVEE